MDERVLSFIRSFVLREGVPPTRQEIADALELPNLMAAQRAVHRLRDQGFLTFDAQSKRGIALSREAASSLGGEGVVELPLLGAVAAGRPIEAIGEALESALRMAVPQSLIRGGAAHFLLQVKGDSMIEDHICDGDYVIVRSQADARDGEKVVAILDGEATLKRLRRSGGRVELHPANASMRPILVGAHQHLRIAGVYAGLIRIER